MDIRDKFLPLWAELVSQMDGPWIGTIDGGPTNWRANSIHIQEHSGACPHQSNPCAPRIRIDRRQHTAKCGAVEEIFDVLRGGVHWAKRCGEEIRHSCLRTKSDLSPPPSNFGQLNCGRVSAKSTHPFRPTIASTSTTNAFHANNISGGNCSNNGKSQFPRTPGLNMQSNLECQRPRNKGNCKNPQQHGGCSSAIPAPTEAPSGPLRLFACIPRGHQEAGSGCGQCSNLPSETPAKRREKRGAREANPRRNSRGSREAILGDPDFNQDDDGDLLKMVTLLGIIMQWTARSIVQQC